MPRSCDLPETLWFEEKKRKTSTAQAHDTFGHLVLLDIDDRAGFTYKSLRNHEQKYYVFSSVRTHPTHLVCLRHWQSIARPLRQLSYLHMQRRIDVDLFWEMRKNISKSLVTSAIWLQYGYDTSYEKATTKNWHVYFLHLS